MKRHVSMAFFGCFGCRSAEAVVEDASPKSIASPLSPVLAAPKPNEWELSIQGTQEMLLDEAWDDEKATSDPMIQTTDFDLREAEPNSISPGSKDFHPSLTTFGALSSLTHTDSESRRFDLQVQETVTRRTNSSMTPKESKLRLPATTQPLHKHIELITRIAHECGSGVDYRANLDRWRVQKEGRARSCYVDGYVPNILAAEAAKSFHSALSFSQLQSQSPIDNGASSSSRVRLQQNARAHGQASPNDMVLHHVHIRHILSSEKSAHGI